MVLEEAKSEIRRRVFELIDCYNAGEMREAAAYYTSDAEWMLPGGDGHKGHDGRSFLNDHKFIFRCFTIRGLNHYR